MILSDYVWVLTDEYVPPRFRMLLLSGSHRYQPERFYEAFGFVRAPREGRFAHRLRAEWSLRVRVVDVSPLRERLYREWRERMS